MINFTGMFFSSGFPRMVKFLVAACCLLFSHGLLPAQQPQPLQSLLLSDIRIKDAFWSPKYAVWTKTTVYDVFDKLEGKYEPDRKDIIEEKQKTGKTRNAFLNFDRVARGDKDTKQFDGPPWYDGLVYETIRGAADLLIQFPDKKLEQKIDAYIDRIAAAQAADPDGYLNTYTTLNQSHQRWGTNGGNDRWQHDVYNAGMLVEAAVHYYKATHKTKLLAIAVRLSNYMWTDMGPAPKKNVVPGHGGPEEALLKLYALFRDEPKLKKQMPVAVNEQQYYDLAKFWIENRGHYGEKGTVQARNSDGSYNQDHMPVLEQPTLEGHAVRATLLATGVTTLAIDNRDPNYIAISNRYWDTMIAKRLFITGGEGAIHEDEKFGPNYFLPENAYLETCASIGAAFFSQKMNELMGDGKYVDELERVVYNNLLSGVSLDGSHYYYENPLAAKNHKRWAWHSCPCCPPMVLKMAGALPSYIYAYDSDAVYLNLYIGNEAKFTLADGRKLALKLETNYPWNGVSKLQILETIKGSLAIKIRIPGWATGKENPFGLYTSLLKDPYKILVNGKPVNTTVENGYVKLQESWKKGDVVEVQLPVEPRLVFPTDSIQTLKGKVAIAAGPLVYGLETQENKQLDAVQLTTGTSMTVAKKTTLLNGVNIINGTSAGSDGQKISFTAIPFYTLANRETLPYKVWLPYMK